MRAVLVVNGVVILLLAGCEPSPMQKQINNATAQRDADRARAENGPAEGEAPAAAAPTGGPTGMEIRAAHRAWAQQQLADVDKALAAARANPARAQNPAYEATLQDLEKRRTAISHEVETLDGRDDAYVAEFRSKLEPLVVDLRKRLEPGTPQ